MYDAIRIKEDELYEADNLDDSGHPIKPNGSRYTAAAAQVQVMLLPGAAKQCSPWTALLDAMEAEVSSQLRTESVASMRYR